MSSRANVLGDYFELVRGTTYRSELIGLPGPVLLGLGTIGRDGGFRGDSLRTYGGESPAKLLVRPGELFLSLKDVTQSGDLLGAVARVPKHVAVGRLTQDTVRLDPRQAGAPLQYLYWLLRTPEYRAYCRSRATGTTNLGLSREDFLSFPVPAPTDEQSTLCRALDELDDKIELNRCMSRTLEAIAQAIFKSWFVEFDPLWALAEGFDTGEVALKFGLPRDALQCFASELIDVNGRMVPEAWRLSSLGQEVKAHGGLLQTGPFGSQLHASDYAEEGVPVVMPQDLVDRRISTARIARVSQETADGLMRHMLRTGDVVYSRRGDVERHARVTAREERWLCGTGCLLVRMGSQWPSPAYLSEVLNDRSTREWIVRHAAHGRRGALRWNAGVRHGCQEHEAPSGHRDAGRCLAQRQPRRKHQLLRRAIGSSAGRGLRPAGKHPRRNHTDADGVPDPRRRFGIRAIRRPKAAGASSASALQATGRPGAGRGDQPLGPHW
jgi:hypothetical protein